jgi:hypothetical protein
MPSDPQQGQVIYYMNDKMNRDLYQTNFYSYNFKVLAHWSNTHVETNVTEINVKK